MDRTDANTSTPAPEESDFWRPWEGAFLHSLGKMGNVTAACRVAHVSKVTAYDHRKKDPEFAAKWQDAEESAADRLEREAWRRAVQGVDRPIYQGGKKVGVVTEYSDPLMALLLKAHKPQKYRENRHTEHSGTLIIDGLRERQEASAKRDSDMNDAPELGGKVR